MAETFNRMQTPPQLSNKNTAHQTQNRTHRESAIKSAIKSADVIGVRCFQRHNTLQLILGCFVIVLSFIYIPAHAAINADQQSINEQGSSQNNDEQTQAHQETDKPDNLIDYVEQKVNTITEEGISASEIADEKFDPI